MSVHDALELKMEASARLFVAGLRARSTGAKDENRIDLIRSSESGSAWHAPRR